MQLTVDHTVADLVPDYNKLHECVKNTKSKVWLFEKHPFNGLGEKHKRKQLKIVQLCQGFKIEGEAEGVGAPLDERISHVISQGKLLPILEVGLQGMNREYVEFLLKMRRNYVIAFQQNCQAQGATCSPRKVAQNLANQWREPDFVLPFI
jgi:hypothetical protein